MKRIVAATDGSESATRGVALAAEMARMARATLHVITVVPGYDEILMEFTQASGRDADEAVARIGRVHLEKTLQAIDLAGITVRTAIRVGRPAVELTIYVEKMKPDLLVLGGRGHVAHYVLRDANCPVALLP